MDNFKELFVEAAQETGMFYSDKTQKLYGKINGFNVSAGEFDSKINIFVSARKHGLGIWIDDVRNISSSVDAVTTGVITNNKARFELVENTKDCLERAMDDITKKMAELELINACERCGTEEKELRYYNDGDDLRHLCSKCYKEEKDGYIAPAPEEEIKENVFGGIVGALIGALLGAAAIIAIGRLGYVASIGGVIMAACALKGYAKLGRKLSVRGIVICVIIMIFMVFASMYFEWAWSFYDEMTDYYKNLDISFFAVFISLFDLLSELGGVGDFAKDLLMLYGFTALGAFGTIKRNYNNI